MSKRKKSPPDDSHHISRRAFLRGTGFAATGSAVLNSSLLEYATELGPEVIGPAATSVILNVNGVDKRVSVEPRTTLADALRYELHLTGTKIVCDRGSCSACTVLLD